MDRDRKENKSWTEKGKIKRWIERKEKNKRWATRRPHKAQEMDRERKKICKRWTEKERKKKTLTKKLCNKRRKTFEERNTFKHREKGSATKVSHSSRFKGIPNELLSLADGEDHPCSSGVLSRPLCRHEAEKQPRYRPTASARVFSNRCTWPLEVCDYTRNAMMSNSACSNHTMLHYEV